MHHKLRIKSSWTEPPVPQRFALCVSNVSNGFNVDLFLQQNGQFIAVDKTVFVQMFNFYLATDITIPYRSCSKIKQNNISKSEKNKSFWRRPV